MPRPTFPANVIDFQRRFSTDKACREFVRDCRWPDGFKCPKCGHGDAYDRAKRRQLECTKCGHCASVTAGTVMANTKVPLRSWLWAAWLMVTSKGGHSASELARQIGVHIETAFTMLHKLRHAMVAPERGMLTGRVEVDESYIGGAEPGRPGRSALTKMIVVGAVESHGERAGRVRFRLIEDVTAASLHGFVRETIEPGSTLVTDGAKVYENIDGYRHRTQIAGVARLAPDDVLRHYHTAVSNLKTWLKGTHHGAVEVKHLQAYLNEFVFRYNRRRNLPAAFQTMLGLASKVGGFTNADLYADVPMHPDPAGRQRPASKRSERRIRP